MAISYSGCWGRGYVSDICFRPEVAVPCYILDGPLSRAKDTQTNGTEGHNWSKDDQPPRATRILYACIYGMQGYERKEYCSYTVVGVKGLLVQNIVQWNTLYFMKYFSLTSIARVTFIAFLPAIAMFTYKRFTPRAYCTYICNYKSIQRLQTRQRTIYNTDYTSLWWIELNKYFHFHQKIQTISFKF